METKTSQSNEPPKATQTNEIPKKKSKKKIIILVLLILVTLLCCCSVVAAVGLIYAFKSNRSVPIFTNAAETIEQKIVDPRENFRASQLDFADKVVLTLEPATEGDGMTYTELLERIETNFDLDYENIIEPTTITYDAKIEMEYGVGSDMKVELSGEGHSDKQNALSNATMNLNIEADNESMTGNLEIFGDGNVDNPTSYIKIGDIVLPDSFEIDDPIGTIEEELDIKIKNKWIKFSTNDLKTFLDEHKEDLGIDEEELEQLFSLSETQTESLENEKLKLTDKQLEDIATILKSEELLGNLEWSDAVTFDDKRARCFKSTWTENEVNDLLDVIVGTDFIEDDDSLDEFRNGLDALKEMSIYGCFDRNNNDLYEIKFYLEVSDKESDQTMKFYFDIKLSGYGEQYTLTLPNKNETVDGVEMIEDLYNKYEDELSSTIEPPSEYTIPDEYYTLFLNSECIHCQNVVSYIEDNNLEEEMSIVMYYTDQDEFAQNLLDQICESEPSSGCAVPLLEVFSYETGDIQYITGDAPIINYFSGKIEQEGK